MLQIRFRTSIIITVIVGEICGTQQEGSFMPCFVFSFRRQHRRREACRCTDAVVMRLNTGSLTQATYYTRQYSSSTRRLPEGEQKQNVAESGLVVC